MIYEFAHFLQKNLKPIWALVEGVNNGLFQLRYGARVKRLSDVIAAYPGVVRVTPEDAPALAEFFSGQPESQFEYFRPHYFDKESLESLSKNPCRLMYMFKDGDAIVGYFFLRCYFFGKNFLGKMVDVHRQGEGIGQKMCCCAMDISSSLRMRMFESIAKGNPASLSCTQNVLETRIVKELENDVLYIEDVRKKQKCG